MAIRAALYARYSSDLQSATSIDDQLRICREQAAREGWQVTSIYKDAAVSGASLILRTGIQALLRDARAGKVDIVLAEAMDRLSRDQADIAILYRELKFARVRIITLAEGEVSELHIGLKGTMNSLFLKDLADKTHRGLRGRVEQGKSGGGLCYGYDVVRQFAADGEPVRGDRRINEAEAEIVRRIYKEFAAGISPRAIAGNLNTEGVSGPFGRAWGDTTIRGHIPRGTGILNNELYSGVLVWNKVQYIKDPSTGKRVPRLNPESEWIRSEVPDLRIVDDELWAAVRQRQQVLAIQYENVTNASREARANRLTEQRRPEFLLSGLMNCGCCGGVYGIVFRDRYGCRNRYRRGNCENGNTVARPEIEERVLTGLKDKLVTPEALAVAAQAYVEEINRRNLELHGRQDHDRQALLKIERAIDGIMKAIEDGLYQPTMKARMEDLERQRAQLQAGLVEIAVPTLAIRPDMADTYRRRVEELVIEFTDPASTMRAYGIIRAMITEVVIRPGARRGKVDALLRGELTGILKAATHPEGSGWVCLPSVDAGAGFEPAAFRL